MQKTEPPIFGENGAILNAEEMQPQSDWPKPKIEAMSRKHWFSIIFSAVISMAAVTFVLQSLLTSA